MSVERLQGSFALDTQGLERLKQTAGRSPDEGLRAVATQFEALLLNRMMQSMQDAIPRSDLFQSSQMDFYRSLSNHQLAQHMAGRGLGLAERLTEQLERLGVGRTAPPPAATTAGAVPATGAPVAASPSGAAPRLPASMPASPAQPHEFAARFRAPAEQAGRETGVPGRLILAQAALESGWGRNEIVAADGRASHNLFGIKAGAGWQGETTDVVTHEFRDGRRERTTESFRVYDSYRHAFADYARLLAGNPRYAQVSAAPDADAAARALQRAGYATDPAYADKLIGVMRQLEGATPASLTTAAR